MWVSAALGCVVVSGTSTIPGNHFSCHRASGRTMEKFSVSVNIAAQSGVTFVLTYEELLQRKRGQYEILMRVKPEQPVQEFQVPAQSASFALSFLSNGFLFDSKKKVFCLALGI